MNIIDFEKTNLSFWNVNPEYKIINPFRDFQKTKGSSMIMWAIALATLPSSKLQNKHEVIAEDFLGDPTFVWKDYEALIESFIELNLNALEVSIYDLGLKLKERSAFIKGTKYTLENAKDLDSILANTQKLKLMYTTLMEELENSQNTGQTKGGRIKSATEKGEL